MKKIPMLVLCAIAMVQLNGGNTPSKPDEKGKGPAHHRPLPQTPTQQPSDQRFGYTGSHEGFEKVLKKHYLSEFRVNHLALLYTTHCKLKESAGGTVKMKKRSSQEDNQAQPQQDVDQKIREGFKDISAFTYEIDGSNEEKRLLTAMSMIQLNMSPAGAYDTVDYLLYKKMKELKDHLKIMHVDLNIDLPELSVGNSEFSKKLLVGITMIGTLVAYHVLRKALEHYLPLQPRSKKR